MSPKMRCGLSLPTILSCWPSSPKAGAKGFLALGLVLAAAAPAWADSTKRASVGTGDVQGNGRSLFPAISADGRFVAFSSRATNLVPGDTNGRLDVFVHDRQTGATSRVSVGSGGTQGNSDSGDFANPALSANGRYVAFMSVATNLVVGDTNSVPDVFVRDRKTGTTSRVSVGPGGAEANLQSYQPALSADGRLVAFQSNAENLVPGDTDGRADVFVHDRTTGKTTRVSVGSDGAQANGNNHSFALSADGRFVAFDNEAYESGAE